MAYLEKFVMFAKDQHSADALISLKVQNNSSPDVCKKVQTDLMKLRTFHMEFDIGSRVGKLPGKVYFTDGWAGLKSFDNILAGSWITIIYANRNLFLIRGKNLYDEELKYPTYNPPKRFLLKNGSTRSPTVACSPTVLFLPTRFKHTMVKELTSADVTDGRLKLGWLGFCQDAFPSEETEITVVDYLGYSWKCSLIFDLTIDMTCSLNGEWIEICKARKFKEGDLVGLGATEDANNMVIYITTPPMMVLRTKLPPSTSSGAIGYVFNVEQYFWKNWNSYVSLIYVFALSFLCSVLL